MKRYHVIVELCAQGMWREYKHDGRDYTFRFRRDADRTASALREIYNNPARWSVSVVRRTVK